MTGPLTGCGVLALAAALAWAWHRWFDPVPLRYHGLYLALLLALFFQPLFFDRWVQLPSMAEIAQKIYPFKAVVPSTPVRDNFLLADVATQIEPWYRLARGQVLAGRFPLYNPTAACGMPLLENAQSSVFTLPSLLSFLFPLPDALTVTVFLNLFLLLLFMHSYLASLKLSPAACAFGALAFGFSGFVMCWLYFPILRILPYWPLLFLCVERLRGGAPRRYTFLLAFALAETVLSGNPESAFIYIVFGSAYFLFRLPPVGGRRTYWLRFTGAALLAMACSAFFWVPFLDYLPHSTRYNLVRMNDPYLSDRGRISPGELVTFVLPLYYGIPPETEGVLGPNNFNELAGYAGLFALFFSLWSFKRHHDFPRLFYWAALGVALLILVRFPPFRALLHSLPLIKYTSLERFRVLATFCVAVLGATGLDRVLAGARFSLPAGAGFAAALLPLMAASPAVRVPLSSILPFFFAGYAFFVLFLLLRGLRAPIVPALLVCAIGDLLLPMARYNPILPLSASPSVTPAVRALQEGSAASGGRVVAEGIQLTPNLNAPFGLEDVRYNDPMTPWHYWRFVDSLHLAKSEYWPLWIVFEGGALDFLNIRHIFKVPQFPMRNHPLEYQGPDGLVYGNPDALARFFVPPRVTRVPQGEEVWRLLPGLDLRSEALAEGPQAVTGPNAGEVLAIEERSPTHYVLRVRGERPFILCSSITALRPWTATLGGRQLPKLTIDGNFLGFAVPAGESSLTVRYRHRLFHWGLGLGLAGLLAAGLASRIRGPSAPPPPRP